MSGGGFTAATGPTITSWNTRRNTAPMAIHAGGIAVTAAISRPLGAMFAGAAPPRPTLLSTRTTPRTGRPKCRIRNYYQAKSSKRT